jgi:hypothetical protein
MNSETAASGRGITFVRCSSTVEKTEIWLENVSLVGRLEICPCLRRILFEADVTRFDAWAGPFVLFRIRQEPVDGSQHNAILLAKMGDIE